MKALHVAVLELRRASRSLFALGMMVVLPLVITGLIHAAFGGMKKGAAAGGLQRVRVVVANLDATAGDANLGRVLASVFVDPQAQAWVEPRTVETEAAARDAVRERTADAAVIIPQGLSTALAQGRVAPVAVVPDAALKIGPRVVQEMVAGVVEGLASVQAAARVDAAQRARQGQPQDGERHTQVMAAHARWLMAQGQAPTLRLQAPNAAPDAADPMASLMAQVMAGMMVFFVFFGGANTAQSLLRGDEDGTLARLFTTPTPRTTILAGHFLAVWLTVAVQVAVLQAASWVLFDVAWGAPLPRLLATLALTLAGAGLGVLVMSFLKTSRQAGPVLGGLLTAMGMVGGLFTVAVPSLPGAMETVALLVPQGWALKVFRLCLAGASTPQVAGPAAVLGGMGLLFLAAGGVVFKRRFS